MRRLLSAAAITFVLVASIADAEEAKVLRFTFGTPGSVTRAGFTQVTVKDAFTPAKGFGFQSTRDLLAYDRGGARIERPKDEYTASVYGAYRTTSDLTAALVEGQSDNAFVVALPDGDYTVWLIAADAEWDPPLFEVWANGAKKLDVRIPRARFVFMAPFQARATGGELRIELKGPHGWILSALLIGKEGPALAEAAAKAERDIFFLTDEELPNWKEQKPAAANPPLALTPAEKERGYVLFPVDYSEPVAPAFVPARAAVGKPLTAFATPGEIEPASFCVLASKDLGRVTVEWGDFAGEQRGQRISRQNVSAGIVRCWPQRAGDSGGKGTFRVVPEKIEPVSGYGAGPTHSHALIPPPAQTVSQWWLTLRVPAGTPAGRYRAAITVRPEKAPPSTLEWRLLVLPFQLARPAGKQWGTWLEGFPPVGGLRGPERRGRNTPAEVDRLARADMADYRDHGFGLVLANYYFGVDESPDGSFTYDVSKLARDLEYLKLLGSNAPVVICFEYACRNLEYRFAEPGKEHVPGTFSPKARQAIVGLVRHIRDEGQRLGWPPLYFFPIDEPGNNKTANRMRFAESVLDFVHEVPGCRTATTVTANCVQRLGDRVDVRIYAYGHFSPGKVRQDAREGHPFWYYNNGMFYGHSTLASRGLAGFEFLRSGAEVATAWGFAATKDNPDNDFDGGHKDWNVVFPGVDRLTPTIYWELCREGVDDCRYVATLQEAIGRAKARGRAGAAQQAEKVLAPLIDPEARPVDNPLAFARYRWRVAREILGLAGDRGSGTGSGGRSGRSPAPRPPASVAETLPFAAVADNPAAEGKVGTNVIEDPSFEKGPQADGFPVASYRISDPYSKPEAKPTGALAVTDEIAHSGRYSLKWDLSRAEGKGSVYGRNRYLIVNVQVPPEAAKALRGKRVRVGYWMRLGGGTAVPGMVLRQFGKSEFLGGITYSGGVEDAAVWNHFEAEGHLRDDFESLDIHTSCRVPDDPEVAKKCLFYIDDVSLQAIEDPPVALSTPLDEYYVGEALPWSLDLRSPGGQVRVALLLGSKVVAEQAREAQPGVLKGTFATGSLKPGVYTVRATLSAPGQAPRSARRQVILAPDPFAWRK